MIITIFNIYDSEDVKNLEIKYGQTGKTCHSIRVCVIDLDLYGVCDVSDSEQ